MLHDINKCSELTSSEPRAELSEYVQRPSTLKKGEDQEGLRLTRAGGSTCDEDPKRQLSFTVDIWCNKDADDAEQVFSPQKDPLD